MILEGPNSRTIAKGDQSHIDDGQAGAGAHATPSGGAVAAARARSAAPRVDFTREMVVGVFMGSRPNAGFSTAIVSATATPSGTLLVRYSEKAPAAGSVSAQILTFPFHLVAIPKADVKDVQFEKVEK